MKDSKKLTFLIILLFLLTGGIAFLIWWINNEWKKVKEMKPSVLIGKGVQL